MKNRHLVRCCVAVVFASLVAAIPLPATAGAPWTAEPMDWPHWRGPEMNGISREKNIVDSWSPSENVLWEREDLASRSTPIVMNGKLYTIVRDQPGTALEGEKVVCIDAATGDEPIWENRWNVYLSDVPDTRVGWSSVVGDPTTGNVFALGVGGYFACIDGETGETIWSRSLAEEYGLLSTYGGRTNFPLVFENSVIISAVVIGWGEMAKPAHRFVAFDKRNGEPIWFEGTRLLPDDTTYSSPVLSVVDGQMQMIFASGDGAVHGFQPRTGKSIWKYNVSLRGINTTPVVVDNVVYCGHSEENLDSNRMGAMFAIDATKTGDITESGEVWRNLEWYIGKSSPVVVDGRIYAAEDTGTLLVADAATGEQIASEKLRGPMRASPLFVDGKIYLCTENGIWWTLKPTDEGVEVLYRARLNIGQVNASPIVSHGRMYVTTSRSLYCIGQEDQEPSVDPRPEIPEETPVDSDSTPAQVQVAPVECLLRPGQRQQFQVRLYNASGQLLRYADASDVQFRVDGPGSIDAQGKYSTPSDADQHSAVTVTAQVGDVQGTARIRLVPELPWTFDFSDGVVPITWVGARYRHIPLDFQLLQTLKSRDERAAQLYIQLMTDFTNSGQPVVKYDNSTPRQQWTDFLIFFGLQGDADVLRNIDAAKQAFESALQELQTEEVVKEWSWQSVPSGPQLTVHRGPRGIESESGTIVKIITIPKGTRSQAWMGHTYLHDYTVEADVLGADRDGRLPDVGIIAQRYTLDLMGASQQLQIRTWPPQLRMAKTVPFEWQPGVWYTMKLRAAVEDGKAVLRGKVWPRDEAEPQEWHVEAVDESPNVQGSPGLYGNAKDGEIFYDRFTVTEN